MEAKHKGNARIESFAELAESPAVSPVELKQLKRSQRPSRIATLLKKPLTLILLTWLIMAILLWLEIASSR